MASKETEPLNPVNDNPTANQEWKRQDSVRDKRGKHGATVVEPTGTSELSFVVTIRILRGKAVNVNTVHKGLLEKMFEACPGIVFRPTSTADTHVKRPLTKLDQFPTTKIGHSNFFAREQKNKACQTSIETAHVIQSSMTVKQLKNAVLSYLLPNNIWIERGELDSIEIFRFGFFQGAHPKMVNRIELKDTINTVVRNFCEIDEYWNKYAKDWAREDELPKVSVWNQQIPWGFGKDRVLSDCVCLCAIRPVCVLMKHIISEQRHLFPYEFIESGHAAMTNHLKYREVLVANNDFQNAVQGISIIGLPRQATRLTYTRGNHNKTIKEWLIDHTGIEQLEPTNETDTEGRTMDCCRST